MRPIHLSRLRIPSGDINNLARLHAEWALGLDRFAFLREERLAAGVPADTSPDDLVDSQGGQWTFKFTLPERPEVSRTSIIKISMQGSDALVEHFVTRDGRPDLIVSPTATPPDVVLWLLDPSRRVEPVALRGHTSKLIDEPDVPSFVDDILAPNRSVPIIVVAVENATRATLVDADELALRLAGMATVFQLASVRVSYRLRDELVGRDMPDKFGCYNGGVRVLRPGIQSRDNPYDHLLLLPVRLLGLLGKSRTEQVAGIFCELVAEGEDPRRWLKELEPTRAPAASVSKPMLKPMATKPVVTKPVVTKPSRYEPAPERPRPRAISETRPELDSEPLTAKLGSIRGLSGIGALDSSAKVSEPLGSTQPALALEPRGEVALADVALAIEVELPPPESDEEESDEEESDEEESDEEESDEEESDEEESDEGESDEGESDEDESDEHRVSPAKLEPRSESTSSTWSNLADDVTAALQLAEEQEGQFEALQAELAEARKQLRRAQQERDELSGPPTSVADALTRAETTYPDRLTVLRSARASANDSPYRDPGRVLFVLLLLANCDASSFGEVLNKAVGGTARWKPRDSPETVAKFGKDRTFTDSNRKPKLFTRHVTLGHGVNSKKCLQIYYDVLGDGRIEIAWCGDHRPTVSEDT